MASLKVFVLGHFQVMIDGCPVERFDTNKTRGLLAYLAVESDRPHSREFLADLLWPNSSHSSALANLRYTLSCLRTALQYRSSLQENSQPDSSPAADGGLAISRDSLEFHPCGSAWVDSAEFSHLLSANHLATVPTDRLETAASLYRGSFLDGLSLPENAAFDEWLLLKREQYNRLMLKALFHLADYYEARGDYEQAQVYAWRQIEIEPWLEEGYQQLMRVLALGGQRSTAISQYETCRRLLSTELGIVPSQETERIYQLVVSGDWDEARSRSMFSMPAAQPQPPSNPPVVASSIRLGSTSFPFETGFVDRKPELERLHTCLALAAKGHGKIVFIRGEPGSGKTALADEFTLQALAFNPALIAAGGACSAQSGVGDPYMPFVEILQMLTGDTAGYCHSQALSRLMVERINNFLPNAIQTVAEQGPELAAHLLNREALVERSRTLSPAAAERIHALYSQTEPVHTHLVANQPAIFEQLTHVLLSLARSHPLLLIINNLQWADRFTIGMLYHLGRRLYGSRVLILGLYRPEELYSESGKANHPLEQTIDEILIEYGDLTIDLSQSDHRRFIDACLDRFSNRFSPEFRRELYRYTNGNPQMVIELLNCMRANEDIALDEEGYFVCTPQPTWEACLPSLKPVIEGRLHRLRPVWLHLLEAACIEGPLFSAELSARLSGVSVRSAISWLSGPLSKTFHLVEGMGVQHIHSHSFSLYRFKAALVQLYLYQQLDAVERVSLHERAAACLEAFNRELSLENKGGPDGGFAQEVDAEVSSRIAWHYQQAGLPELAKKYAAQPEAKDQIWAVL